MDDKKCLLKGAHNLLLWLSPEGSCQSVTDTKADTISQPLDSVWGSPVEELENGLENLKGFAVPWKEQ